MYILYYIKVSSKKYRKKLLRTEDERSLIISKLMDVDVMLRGSYALIYTKCGKDNCRCKDKAGHPHSRITWSEQGQGVTRKVPREYIDWIKEVTNNYRQFRLLRKKLVSLEAETKRLLDAYEKELIKSTRSGKCFLEIDTQNRKEKSPLVPKKKNRKKTTPA